MLQNAVVKQKLLKGEQVVRLLISKQFLLQPAVVSLTCNLPSNLNGFVGRRWGHEI